MIVLGEIISSGTVQERGAFYQKDLIKLKMKESVNNLKRISRKDTTFLK